MADFTNFDSFADLYERETEPLTAPFARRAFALAALPAGARIIDVASGTGVLALAAAEAGARGLATDLSPPMVARLAARLRPYSGFETETMSADALGVGDGGFDAAFSLFGVANLPIWRAGFAELVRVTRPGGRIVVSAWPNREGSAPMLVVRRVFERLFPDRAFWPGEMLTIWTRQGLADALTAAGCTDVAVHDISCTIVKPQLARMVDDALPMFRIVPGIKALCEADLARLRDPLVEAFAAFAESDGLVRLPIEGRFAVGTKAR